MRTGKYESSDGAAGTAVTFLLIGIGVGAALGLLPPPDRGIGNHAAGGQSEQGELIKPITIEQQRMELRGVQPSIVTGSSTIVSLGFIPDSSAER